MTNYILYLFPPPSPPQRQTINLFRCLWLIDTKSVSITCSDSVFIGLKPTYSTFLTSNSNTSIHFPCSCIVQVYDLFIVLFLMEENLARFNFFFLGGIYMYFSWRFSSQERWLDPVNRFNSSTFLYLSQATPQISIGIHRGIFVFNDLRYKGWVTSLL